MIKCPVCSKYKFAMNNNFDVCPVCEWENDGVQLQDPDYDGGANDISLNAYRAKWQKHNMQSPIRQPAYATDGQVVAAQAV